MAGEHQSHRVINLLLPTDALSSQKEPCKLVSCKTEWHSLTEDESIDLQILCATLSLLGPFAYAPAICKNSQT